MAEIFEWQSPETMPMDGSVIEVEDWPRGGAQLVQWREEPYIGLWVFTHTRAIIGFFVSFKPLRWRFPSITDVSKLNAGKSDRG